MVLWSVMSLPFPAPERRPAAPGWSWGVWKVFAQCEGRRKNYFRHLRRFPRQPIRAVLHSARPAAGMAVNSGGK